MNCAACEDTGWVCEAHPHRSWDGPHAAAAAQPATLPPLPPSSWPKADAQSSTA